MKAEIPDNLGDMELLSPGHQAMITALLIEQHLPDLRTCLALTRSGRRIELAAAENRRLREQVDFFSPAHVISYDGKKELVQQADRFRQLSEGGTSVSAVTLSYDLHDSTHLFHGGDSSFNRAIHGAAGLIGYLSGFRFREQSMGDGCMMVSAVDFEPDKKKKETLDLCTLMTDACRCAVYLQMIIADPIGTREVIMQQFPPDSKEARILQKNAYVFADLAHEIRSLPTSEPLSFGIGLTVGDIRLGPFAASIEVVDGHKVNAPRQAVVERRRRGSPYITGNVPSEQLLRHMGFNPDDNFICLDEKSGLYLVKLDHPTHKPDEMNTWLIVMDRNFSRKKAMQLSRLTALAASKSNHYHFEGSIENYDVSQVIGTQPFGWNAAMVERYPTGSLQIGMLEAYMNPDRYLVAVLNDPIFRSMITDLSHFSETEQTYMATADLKAFWFVIMAQGNFPRQALAMMAYTYALGQRMKKQADFLGKALGSPLYVSMHNLSEDAGITTLTRVGMALSAQKKIGNKFPGDFKALTAEQYLSALRLGLGEPVVICLRRDRPDGETWYMQNPDDRATDKFIARLCKYKEAGLIAGVDIAGLEEKYSLKEMEGFIQKLKDNNLLYSLHAGEETPEKTASGLRNIVEAIKYKDIRVGHAFSLWYLLAASEDNPLLALQRPEIGEIAQELGLAEDAPYSQIAMKILDQVRENRVSIQLCLVSNLLICLQNMTADGLEIGSATAEEKFPYHPFVAALKKFGPEIIGMLPRLSISADNFSIVGHPSKHQIQMLVRELLQFSDGKWGLDDIRRLFAVATGHEGIIFTGYEPN